MAINAVMTMLCLVGVTFYVRFLVALCGEWRSHSIFYRVRQHAPSNFYTIPEPRERKKPVARAA
jgi:hypothetical protein